MFQLFVEGRGENAAAQKLVHKIIKHYNLGDHHFSEGRRMPNLHMDDGLRKAIEIARLDSRTKGVLIIRDDEDNCPKEIAPQKARLLQQLNAPFPIGYCIMYREFETLFVAYARYFAGKKIPHQIRGEIEFLPVIPDLDPESVRGAKEKISSFLSGGRTYKPTTDQLSLTQAIDIGVMAGLQLPAFETLVRCLSYITQAKGSSFVYPIV